MTNIKSDFQIFTESQEFLNPHKNFPLEVWKDIKGYEGHYQVSNYSRVKSLERIVTTKRGPCSISMRILKAAINDKGYYSIVLRKKGIGTTKILHRIIAKAFIPNPNNKPQVNHLNHIRDDNRLHNLEWVTAKENSDHANTYKKLSDEDVRKIRRLEGTMKMKELALMFNISGAYVHLILNGKGRPFVI